MTPSTLLNAFEILADLFPEGVLIVGADGVIQAANEEFARIVGCDRSDIVGQQLEQFVPPRHRMGHVLSRTDFFASGASRPMGVGLDLHAQRADGSEVPIDVSLGSVDLEDGPAVIAAVRDLTGQYEAEKTRSMLEIVHGASRSAVFVIETNGVVAGANHAATRLLGVDVDDLVDHPLDLTVLGATEQVIEIFDHCRAGGRVEDIPVELVTAWDDVVPVNLTAHPVTSSRGQISAVSLVLFDRSEQEASQSALHQFQARLETTERLGGLGSWELDGVTGELQMSPGLHELLGIAPFDAEGQVEDLLRKMSSELQESVRESLERCIESREPMSLEGRLVSRDGHQRWITIEGGRDAAGDDDSQRRVVGIVQDVTARHEAMAALVQADRLKDEFLSTVSHELRTPLTVILGFADHLRGVGDDSTAAYLDAMYRNAAEMDLMVDQLLDMSRVQSGHVTLDLEPASLRTVVGDTLTYLAATVRHRRIVDDTSDVVILVDAMGFRRLLTNLVSNTAKFSPPDSTITISDIVEGDEVIVSVCDEGIGIDAEDLDSIFDMFVQARHGRPVDVPGTGVGLTIVKRYVEMHGGHVWVESEPGGGTCFRFTIPVSTVAPSEDGGT